MMVLSECLKPDTPVYLTRDRDFKKGFFYKDETPELFIKNFNHAEFIGEELCGIHDIRCTHYFVVACGFRDLKRNARVKDLSFDYRYQIASYDFRKPGKTYKTLDNYIDSKRECFKYMLERANNREQLRIDILKMLAIDLYMGQTDRVACNTMFEEDSDNNIRLAPLYDFEYSLKDQYLDPTMLYYSDLISFRTIDELKDFIRKHPELGDMLSEYLKDDLCECTDRAYRQRGLKVPDSKWQFYEEFDANRKQMIKRII